MPNIRNIPADGPTPTVDPRDLAEAVDEARQRVADIRAERQRVRRETPKPKLAAALAETDQAYVDAIATVDRLERRASRMGRIVKVNPATDTEGAANG